MAGNREGMKCTELDEKLRWNTASVRAFCAEIRQWANDVASGEKSYSESDELHHLIHGHHDYLEAVQLAHEARLSRDRDLLEDDSEQLLALIELSTLMNTWVSPKAAKAKVAA